MIELTRASFQYENSYRGVQDISLSVKSGECVVLTGLSGCGKTTVTRLVNGLAPSYYPGVFSGSVRIDGKDISRLSTWEIGRLVGSVFQDPKSQFFSSELAGEVAFPCENYGLSAREIRERTDAAIEALHLSHLKDRAVDVLSSGEKQRAAIASVYAMKPKVFVCDEPTANLDAAGTRQLAQTLRQLKAQGFTLLLAEHRIDWLMGIADRFLYLRDGRIAAEYAPRDLLLLPEADILGMGLRSPHEGKCLPAPSVLDESPAVLKTAGLSKRIRKEVIFEDISLSVPKGGVTAITGQNGAGKTTLAQILCGLARQTRGHILISQLMQPPLVVFYIETPAFRNCNILLVDVRVLRLQTLQVVLTDAGFTHRLIADTVFRFTPLADSRAAPSHFCDDTALQPPHFRFNVLIVSFLCVSLGLKLQIPGDQQCHIPLQYQLRRRWVSRPEMTPDAVEDQVAVLRVGRRCTGENMVLPEIPLQRDQLLLIVMVTVNMTDDNFIFIVAVQAAIEDLVNIHHGHIVPPLGLIVEGNDLLSVLRPPVILCVVIGRFDLQNSSPAFGKLYEVVNIRQHKRMHRMIKHLLDLIDAISRFYVEYLRYQIFQQMPHLLGYPVALRVVKRHDFQLVIVEIPCRSKRGDPQYGGRVAAADPPAPVFQPVFLRKALRADQD